MVWENDSTDSYAEKDRYLLSIEWCKTVGFRWQSVQGY